jgi:hypothetical protein
MPQAVVDLILNEGVWPLGSLLLSVAVVGFLIRKKAPVAGRPRVIWALNTMYGCFIGIMACGHLLAVTIKLAAGTLEGSPLFLYPLGIVLAVPSWWLVFNIARYVDADRNRSIIALNAFLGISLLGAGPANLPLALFAVLNIVYLLSKKRAVEMGVAVVAAVAYVSLLIGTTIFLASGQSFEKFSGMR